MANGGIIGVANTPTTSVASGVWSLQEQESARKAGIWPNNDTALELDFDETTTLDSRITFTRATSATYFDSSGVLSTASSGAARFDHRLENSVWVNKGLLIEEQRTNLILRSEEFNVGGSGLWNNAETTETADATTAPDGNTTADALLETVANDFHAIYQQKTGLGATTNYAFSVFVKANGRNVIQLQLQNTTNNASALFDLTDQSITTSSAGTGVVNGTSIEDVGDGWYRCTIIGYSGQTTTNHFVFIALDDGTLSYTGDVTKGVYVWGAQVEAGAFPTSYIPTTTASVTRNADVASMTSTNFSDWYNATEGTVFIQNDFNGFNSGGGGNRYWEISDNTANERLFFGTFAALSPANATRYAVIDGGATQAIIDTSFAAVGGTTYKSIVVYKQNDFVLTVDGTQIGTDTSGTLPTVNRIDLGALFAASASLGYMNGHIAKFYYWNTRKSNAFLQGVTS